MLRVGTVGTSSIMRTIQEAIRLTDGMECRVVYSRTEEQIEESQVIGKVLCILFPGCGESSSRDFGRIGALDNG